MRQYEARRHPHAEAQYAVFAQHDGTFAVRVTVPDSCPTTITSFVTEAAATEWIATHKDKAGQRLDLKRPRVLSFPGSRRT